MNETRRTLQQIYYDIMTALISIHEKDEDIKLTVIQLKSKLAYNKLKNHLKKMKKLNLITNNYKITENGRSFYNEFTGLLQQVNNLQSTLEMNVNLPAPTKITKDGLEFIQNMKTVLEDQVKLSKSWIKFQKEMK